MLTELYYLFWISIWSHEVAAIFVGVAAIGIVIKVGKGYDL